MEKTNTTAIGLHLIPGSADGILTYSDGIADVNYEHLDNSESKGALQSEINKELKEALFSELDWHEE